MKKVLLKKGITNVIDEICCKEGEKLTCKYSSWKRIFKVYYYIIIFAGVTTVLIFAIYSNKNCATLDTY